MSLSKIWSHFMSSGRTSMEPEEAYAQGMAAWEKGELDTAQSLLEQAVDGAPEELKHVGNLGNLYHQRGHRAQALSCHQRASELAPNHPGAHRNQGRVLMEMGRFQEASQALAKSLALEPSHSECATLCAQSLASSGEFQQAWKCCEQSIGDGAASPELHTLYLELLFKCKELDKTLQAAQLPDVEPAMLHRVGIGLLKLNRSVDAAQVMSIAQTRDPENHALVYHQAIAEKNAGHRALALKSFALATKLDPADPMSRSNLAWLQLQHGEQEAALENMHQAAILESHRHAPVEEISQVPAHRIRHDAEQFRYILKKGKLSQEAQSYADDIMALEAAMGDSDAPVDLTQPSLNSIRTRWSELHHNPTCPVIEDGALNPKQDWNQIQNDYRNTKPEMVVVDDLLRPEALHALQEWCRTATIWKRSYDNGYVGAFMRSGLASALIIQISEELRTSLSGIIQDYRLEQCWAFKCDSSQKAVNLHADVAAINVNFWIGPDAGNENPERGGLLVWDKESPSDWAFEDYNANQTKMRDFLKSTGAQAQLVPHRCNRALVFNSTLFHESDQIQFRPDYEYRRINITMLYGIRLLEH